MYKSIDEFMEKYYAKSYKAKKDFQDKVDLLKLCGFTWNAEGRYFFKSYTNEKGGYWELTFEFVQDHSIEELKDVLRHVKNEERIIDIKLIDKY